MRLDWTCAAEQKSSQQNIHLKQRLWAGNKVGGKLTSHLARRIGASRREES